MRGFRDFVIGLETSGSGAIHLTTEEKKYKKFDLVDGNDETQPGFIAGLRKGAKAGFNRGQEGKLTQDVVDDLKFWQDKFGEDAIALKEAFDWACKNYKKLEDKIEKFKLLGFQLNIDLRYIVYILVAIYFGGLTSAKSVSIPYSVIKWYAMWYFGERIENKLDAAIKEKLEKTSPANESLLDIFSPEMRNKLGYAVGYGAGFLGGETKKAISKISNFLIRNKDYFIQLAKDAGIQFAKVLLIATLVTFGSQAYNIGAGLLNTALDTVINSGLLQPEEVYSIATIEYIQEHLPKLDNAVAPQGLLDKLRAYFGNFLTKIPLMRAGWLGTDTGIANS